jgi:hypothetical protein
MNQVISATPWRVTIHHEKLVKVENRIHVVFDGFISRHADAYLAAASPELLEATQLAMNHIRDSAIDEGRALSEKDKMIYDICLKAVKKALDL